MFYEDSVCEWHIHCIIIRSDQIRLLNNYNTNHLFSFSEKGCLVKIRQPFLVFKDKIFFPGIVLFPDSPDFLCLNPSAYNFFRMIYLSAI